MVWPDIRTMCRGNSKLKQFGRSRRISYLNNSFLDGWFTIELFLFSSETLSRELVYIAILFTLER